MTVATLIEELLACPKKEMVEIRLEDKQTDRTFPIIWDRKVIKDGKTFFYLSFDSESVG